MGFISPSPPSLQGSAKKSLVNFPGAGKPVKTWIKAELMTFSSGCSTSVTVVMNSRSVTQRV